MQDSPEDKDNKFTIKPGSKILIILDRRRRWIRVVEEDKRFHCNKGFFDYNEILGKPFGTSVKTNKSTTLWIYFPTPTDELMSISHSSQIIYPKDAGLILLYGGIKNGSKIIEIGTGSGALTSVLANYVGPKGMIYSYEIREKAYIVAKKNIKKLGLEANVVLKNVDGREGFNEKNVDAIVVDMGDPWEIIESAYEALRPSGIISFFIPTTNQLEKVYIKLKENNFKDIEALELIERGIQLKENAIRPKTWTHVGHTGYLVFARKFIEE